MTRNTKIDWCDTVWNPIVGCSKISEGCRNCYAARTAKARAKNPKTSYKYAPVVKWDGKVFFAEKTLEAPLHWRKPRRVFVNSMGDLFHENVPDKWLDYVFAVMGEGQYSTFYILTKRPERMGKYFQDRDWGEASNYIVDKYLRTLEGPLYLGGEIVPPLSNVWLGVSVEDQKTADQRIPELLKIPGFKKFVSVEPMLGPIFLRQIQTDVVEIDSLTGAHGVLRPLQGCSDNKLDWVICGGETGPGARPMHLHWIQLLRDQCMDAGVPFFFKSWGEYCPGCQLPCETKIVNYDNSVLMNALGDIGKSFPTDDGVDNVIRFFKIGKKRSGYILDGKEHRELPA